MHLHHMIFFIGRPVDHGSTRQNHCQFLPIRSLVIPQINLRLGWTFSDEVVHDWCAKWSTWRLEKECYKDSSFVRVSNKFPYLGNGRNQLSLFKELLRTFVPLQYWVRLLWPHFRFVQSRSMMAAFYVPGTNADVIQKVNDTTLLKLQARGCEVIVHAFFTAHSYLFMYVQYSWIEHCVS